MCDDKVSLVARLRKQLGLDHRGVVGLLLIEKLA